VSLWGVHIGIAVIITTLIVGPLPFSQVERWGLIFISGLWATVPDWWWFFTDRFVSGLDIPWYAQTYKAMLHDSAVANVFWLHGIIDAIGTDDELSSLLIAGSSVAVFATIEVHLARGETTADSASQ